jgi:hypothetical protein
MSVRQAILMLTLASFLSPSLQAEVSHVTIASRHDVLNGYSFGDVGPYEYLTGRIFFEVDPSNPNNRIITDIEKAPKNSAGRVEFSSDLGILQPKNKTRGNGFALIDIPNRGGGESLRFFNMGVGTVRQGESIPTAALGDGFLLRQGYTIVFVGWQFGIVLAGGMNIDVVGAGGVNGVAHATLIPDRRSTETTFQDLVGYTPRNPSAAENSLTVRDHIDDASVVIPRNKWQLAGNRVTLAEGFVPGRIYELSYLASDPPIGGLGFAAVRDTASWIKYNPAAEASARNTIAYGISQTGRFLNDFLYLGFDTDERDRQVLDGVMNQIAGVSRTDINTRWGTPTALKPFQSTSFPFSPARQHDPVTGVEEGAIENSRTRDYLPKVFYTNTDVEYWGGGRVAALLHATPDGSKDTTLPENARAYLFAGTQHAAANFPSRIVNGQQADNPNDYRWSLRALLVALQQWVSKDTPPPQSQYPRIQDQTLVRVQDVSFPKIPGVRPPRSITAGKRIANPLVEKDGAPGTPIPLLVPEVDEDGNDVAGIRLPEVAVPLATYTGWNFRNNTIGGVDQLYPLLGSYVPFPRTAADRESTHDPRLSIAERYPKMEDYLAQVENVAVALAKQRYLLAEDIPLLVRHAQLQWTFVTGTIASKPLENRPTFQTISIKPNNSGSADGVAFFGTKTFTATNSTLREHIKRAYGLEDYQVSGGPVWLSIDRFDIEAVAAVNTNTAQMRLMLQTLLEDRFHLQFHRELRRGIEIFVIDNVIKP